jgi:hypothetical protein
MFTVLPFVLIQDLRYSIFINQFQEPNMDIFRAFLLLKIIALWYVAPSSLVQVKRRFRYAYCLHHYRPHDGDSTNFRNVGLFQLHYTALYPIKVPYSYSPPREAEIYYYYYYYYYYYFDTCNH